MSQIQKAEIQGISIHYTGNRANGENIRLSKSPVKLSQEISDLLAGYFLSSFKSQEYYNFFHETGLQLNEVFVYCERIFDDPASLHEQSENLARHLFEKSGHPKIKGGEFYTVYFRNCMFNDETIDAVGLFKSESRETYIKVYPKGDGYQVDSDEGINIRKLDKGCIVFNLEKENGYMASVVDNTNKGVEALYWTDDFLHVRPRKDEYYNTQNILTICKNFVTQELPQHFEVTKADQADLLNKSVKFFKENDEFSLKEFSQEVMESPEVIKSFNKYKKSYQDEYDIEMEDRFAISDGAVKKQARIFKSVIKLDKNFHIYIHGNRNMIEQGVDENGRKYYKIFYQEEN
jgi:hypothetical protein